MQYDEGDWIYHDSYLGESNFIGQELVYYRREPVWGMNYFGYLVKPDRITAAQAGQVIMASLTRLYQEGRFLGGFEHVVDGFRYVDANDGDVRSFVGKEHIDQDSHVVYELVYHGGELRP